MPSITVAPTPNPNSLKFTLAGATFLPEGMASFGSAAEAEGDALGSALFSLRGVHNVFVTPGFLTVTKHPAAGWNTLSDEVERVIQEHLGDQD